MNRVTLFIGGLSGGGAERVTCNLANFLNQKGYSVDLITMSNKQDTYRLDRGVNRINLLDEKERRGRIYNLRIRARRLKDYVVNNQDVSCYVVMLPVTIFMLMRLKKFTKSKIIISERNNPRSYSLCEKIMMKYSAKRCDGLVVQTKEIGDWYKNVHRKVVIPNAINKDVAFPRRKKIEKKIVTVSRLEKQKNIPMLIKAFAEINKKHDDYVLEIYGKGSLEKKLRNLARKCNLDERVKFMGYTDNITERIANATCFVLTSNYEGMPNALIEAMCVGIPCVATDCDGGGSRELISDRHNGILIKKGSVKELASNINDIINNETYAKMLSSNATKLRRVLDSELVYEKWLNIIRK